MRTKETKTSKTQATNPKPNECVCGCGAKVRHLFAQGHDQRVRGMLQRNAENAKANPLPKTLLQAIRQGVIKHLERVRPNAVIAA